MPATPNIVIVTSIYDTTNISTNPLRESRNPGSRSAEISNIISYIYMVNY